MSLHVTINLGLVESCRYGYGTIHSAVKPLLTCSSPQFVRWNLASSNGASFSKAICCQKFGVRNLGTSTPRMIYAKYTYTVPRCRQWLLHLDSLENCKLTSHSRIQDSHESWNDVNSIAYKGPGLTVPQQPRVRQCVIVPSFIPRLDTQEFDQTGLPESTT